MKFTQNSQIFHDVLSLMSVITSWMSLKNKAVDSQFISATWQSECRAFTSKINFYCWWKIKHRSQIKDLHILLIFIALWSYSIVQIFCLILNSFLFWSSRLFLCNNDIGTKSPWINQTDNVLYLSQVDAFCFGWWHSASSSFVIEGI